MPQSLRDKLRPLLKAVEPLNHGPKAARLAAPSIRRDWSGVAAGSFFQSDDETANHYIWQARIHFPDLSDDHLDFIVSHVRAFQGSVLSCIENIARLSRIYAEENGRQGLKLSDIKQAISDCLPSRPRPDQTPKEVGPAAPVEASVRKPQAQDEPVFEQNERTQGGSLLRLNRLATGQKNRIEDPALVLAD